jgi:diadenosine tetraphosphate (Ap4A) HIT family hydrolase
VEGCWFCLSSADVDVSLVASVGDEAYVALDKGQISPTHALVVPIEHYPSMLTLPAACGDEVTRYLSSLRAAFASQGRVLVGFERHLALRSKGGNHCHINVLGVSPEAGAGAREAFEEVAAAAGFELTHVPPKAGGLDRWVSVKKLLRRAGLLGAPPPPTTTTSHLLGLGYGHSS